MQLSLSRFRIGAFVSALLFLAALPSQAQFGSGIVFDPTQSAHALQQIEQNIQNSVTWQQQLANTIQLLATADKDYQQAITTYNMIHGNLQNFSSKSIWKTIQSQLTMATFANQYGETTGLQSAMNGQAPGTASMVWKLMNLGLNSTSSSFLSSQVLGQDKVLLIGDIRQHQGVDAGKPFEQLQQAGMQTAQLDTIVRQRDPQLLKAVEHLSKNETEIGVQMLQQQGRVAEIVDPQERITAIAKAYAAHPENTIIVSPDNASRRAINQAVRQELQALGTLGNEDHAMRVLTPRSDMTGADRAWAARYQAGDVLHYIRGSREHGIEGGSYAQVVATDPKENLVTVRKENGEQVTYDPSRLRGISAYREIEREFAISDRIQLTAPNRELGVANRDLGTLQQIGEDGRMTVRMDGDKEKTITFDPRDMRHLDHGYAVTSHSSQGLTSERVLVNMDTEVHHELINPRFAYVSVSRASHDAQIFTNDAATLAKSLSHDVSKPSAIDFGKSQNPVASVGLEQAAAAVKQTSATGLGLAL
jgi:hypothetical protein